MGDRKTLKDSLVWMWPLVPRCVPGAELRAQFGESGEALFKACPGKAPFRVPSFVPVSGYSSDHDLSTVHHQRLAGDAACRVGAEENRCRGDVRAFDVALEGRQMKCSGG